ncbi:hypothetical protein U1Q18_047213 [Sarracenia purpurea var. burkii]
MGSFTGGGTTHGGALRRRQATMVVRQRDGGWAEVRRRATRGDGPGVAHGGDGPIVCGSYPLWIVFLPSPFGVFDVFGRRSRIE